MYHCPHILRSRARALRKSMTHAEVKLWVALQGLNRQGFRFRKQVPLDGYILDFAEFGHRLILEVDGGQHGTPEGEIRDARRDVHFGRSGFHVVRVWNNEVHENLDGVVHSILCVLNETGPSRPLRGHPPRKGEG